MTTRRGFLTSALAATFMPRLSWADAGNPTYLGAAREANGDYALYGLSYDGQPVMRVDLPARGHAAAAHPYRPEAVAFARRPGTFALVLNCVSGKVMHRLDAPKGRHFMGHGVFVDAGDLLITPENSYFEKKGVLGIWDRRKSYARIGEIDSGGIGPHDIKKLADGTLVIANGGIFTHPDFGEGREKLNIGIMRPNLTYISADFSFEERLELDPDLAKNSIRHLAISDTDQVAFAMQWQGDKTDVVPLLGLHRRGEAPVLAEASLAEQMAMKAYAGSIAFSGDGQSVAITSPRGGRLHRFTPDGQFLGADLRLDLCGLASRGTGWIGSDGQGGLTGFGSQIMPLCKHAGLAWDNHLVSLADLG